MSRSDLPDTLQVGLSLNFGGGNADLDVAFDEFTVSATAPASAQDCAAD